MDRRRKRPSESESITRRRIAGFVGALVPALGMVGLGTSGAALAASLAPPWVEPGAELLPSWVQSVRILNGDQPLRITPAKEAQRRGSGQRDALLPVYAARSGPGCKARWLQIGPFAWVCGEFVELSGKPPIASDVRTFPEADDGLPHKYFFVSANGTQGYKQLEKVDIGEPDTSLEPGFAVAVVAEAAYGGEHYARINTGFWVPMRDLGPVHPFTFHGEDVPAGTTSIPFAWVVDDHAKVLGAPTTFGQQVGSKAKFEVVPFVEDAANGKLLRIGPKEWMLASEVRHARIAEPPTEVDAASGERWIDVDLTTQTLVAYEGKRPVFATLVSTGKGKPGTPLGTPLGTHRIWIKLLTTTMDNLEDENAQRFYRMEDVPWVQFFSKGVGLHGAFWHRQFGHVRSHGCVNLTPLDAQKLFWFTSPHLPAGWTAAAPQPLEPGTIVRVRQ
jgi:lipoprotein-anchoring transpeptidase ErfK/SrfK